MISPVRSGWPTILPCTWSRSPTTACMRSPPRPRSPAARPLGTLGVDPAARRQYPPRRCVAAGPAAQIAAQPTRGGLWAGGRNLALGLWMFAGPPDEARAGAGGVFADDLLVVGRGVVRTLNGRPMQAAEANGHLSCLRFARRTRRSALRAV